MNKVLILSFIVLFVPNSYAEPFAHTSKIEEITSITNRDDADYVQLTGFTSAGSCPTHNGLVVARFPTTEAGNRAFSTALSAKMAGKSVRVAVDDTYKNSNGFCFVNSIRISD